MRSLVRHIATILVTVLLSLAGGRALAQEHLYPFMVETEPQSKVNTEWGVGVGAVYTGFGKVSSDAVALHSRLGIQGHLDMALLFGHHFALESKIIFERGGIDAEYRNKSYDITTTSMEMPVLLSLRMLDGALRLNGGVEFGLISNGGYLDGRDSYMFGTVTPTWNLATGLGISILPNILLELRYIHALQDGVNQLGATTKGAGHDFKTRTHKVILGLSLLL